jgi:DNA/RNA endonuclease YhcR with UshA esterase domain
VKENSIMSKKLSVALLGMSLIVLVVGAQQAAAQQGAGRNPQPGSYDVAAEQTVKGTVADVQQATGPGPGSGTHVTLTTATGTVALALGPSQYMTQKKYVLAAGDEIEVIGAKTQVDGHDVLVVREIKKGSETMTFRNAKGFPMWSGRAGR